MTLLFTSYLVVTAVAMLITNWVSSRLGAKKTLIAGLILIVVFSALAGASPSISGIIGFRAGQAVSRRRRAGWDELAPGSFGTKKLSAGQSGGGASRSRSRLTVARRSSARFSSAGSAATSAACWPAARPATDSDITALRCAVIRS